MDKEECTMFSTECVVYKKDENGKLEKKKKLTDNESV